MESRAERNRTYRRNKRRIKLLMFVAIVLIMTALFQVNHSYEELISSKETSQVLGWERDENSVKIVLLGEQIQISGEYIDRGQQIFQNTQNQVLKLIQSIAQKVSNN